MTTIDLATLTAGQGFAMTALTDGNPSTSVAGIGDVNGDGLADIVVGAPGSDNNTGAAYVLYGKAGGYDGTLALTALTPDQGYRIGGGPASGLTGFSVASAGDVNGDGIGDLLIGAYGTNDFAGSVYIVYGQAGAATGPVDLGTLTNAQGFRLDGGAPNQFVGYDVASGDFNGDGASDLLVGAPRVNLGFGAAYLVYLPGVAIPGPLAIEFNSLPINGQPSPPFNGPSLTGWSVANAGDLNADGIDDLVIGAPRFGEISAPNFQGGAYVVYGSASPSPVDLAALTPDRGFVIQGISDRERVGWSVAGAGDFNGDGVDDVIIGAPNNPTGFDSFPGKAYVVYGRAGGVNGPVNVNVVDPTVSVALEGAERGDQAGYAVSAAGDVNGDGIDDVIVGAFKAEGTGLAYVVYGKQGGYGIGLQLGALTPEQGFVIRGAGADNAGLSVSAAGDLNGDGLGDLLVGASGGAYVVYGFATPQNWTGGSGNDTRAGNAADDVLNGAEGNDSLSGLGGADTLVGNSGNDTLAGGDGADLLSDSGGNDSLDGGAGSDTMIGGTGDDAYRVDTVGDIILESAGGGMDTVFASVTWTLAPQLETLVLAGAAAINGTGNGLANLILGNAAANRLTGGGGSDTLVGGGGSDTLVGGAGADTFRFPTSSVEGLPVAIRADAVLDFSSAAGDRVEILLSAFDPLGTTGLSLGQLSAQAGRFEANLAGKATAATTRLAYETDKGRLSWDPDGNGADGAVPIATFRGFPAVTAADIWLI